ncbi:hypothetical protein HZC30_04870 [Candidatus Woesearchaeota archaeon]|nr:hypothetical protein [Candidatus Woesearchaeota archaeon]
MANRRKMKCDCGTYLKEKETEIEHILTKAMVCPTCTFTTLTKDQAKEFRIRLEFHKAIDQERQVIKVGNSMGITLPEKLHEFGVNIGTKVKIEAIDQKSFRVEIR